jgi:hypothetical protein
MISSAQVQWIKQGSFTIVDDEPTPPTQDDYYAEKGWKMVNNYQSTRGGTGFMFPVDQILKVNTPYPYCMCSRKTKLPTTTNVHTQNISCR